MNRPPLSVHVDPPSCDFTQAQVRFELHAAGKATQLPVAVSPLITLQTVSPPQVTIPHENDPASATPPVHSPLWATGADAVPLGKIVQATLIVSPEQVHAASYAAQVGPGGGLVKHVPTAEQPSAIAKAQA